MNISVIGGNGQLGRALQQLASNHPEWTFHFAVRSTVDLTQIDTVEPWLDQTRPDAVINCAAYTNVNLAEQESDLAHLINVEAVASIARSCQVRNIPLFHYSSDYVYHTEKGIPYQETDATEPKGVYAKTKLAGEQQALVVHPLTTVIRTSWVYAENGHNFVNTMLRLGTERDELKVVCDQIGTPTYALDLAAVTLEMLAKWKAGVVSREQLAGIYNFSSEGVCSWYDFALAIFELRQIECRVYPVESHEFPSPVARPHYSVLNKTKIKNTFDLEIAHWRTALENCLQRMNR